MNDETEKSEDVRNGEIVGAIHSGTQGATDVCLTTLHLGAEREADYMSTQKAGEAGSSFQAIRSEKRIPLIPSRRYWWETKLLIVIYVLEIPQVMLCSYLIDRGYGYMNFHSTTSYDYFSIAVDFSLALQAVMLILIGTCMTVRSFRKTDRLRWKIQDSILRTIFGFTIYGGLFVVAVLVMEIFELFV